MSQSGSFGFIHWRKSALPGKKKPVFHSDLQAQLRVIFWQVVFQEFGGRQVPGLLHDLRSLSVLISRQLDIISK
jgi:hypothetical protein